MLYPKLKILKLKNSKTLIKNSKHSTFKTYLLSTISVSITGKIDKPNGFAGYNSSITINLWIIDVAA